MPRELLANFGPKEPVHVPHLISFDEFTGMFASLRHSAWRLETRRRYASDEAAATYTQFLAEGRVDWDLDDPWCVGRREQRDLGKRFERVRILDTPATVGQRYLLDNARRNAEVGEDIRTLTHAEAQHLRLPEEDFWIFDSRVCRPAPLRPGRRDDQRRTDHQPRRGPALRAGPRGRLAPRRPVLDRRVACPREHGFSTGQGGPRRAPS